MPNEATPTPDHVHDFGKLNVHFVFHIYVKY